MIRKFIKKIFPEGVTEKLFTLKIKLKVLLLEWFIRAFSAILNRRNVQDRFIKDVFRKFNWNVIDLCDYYSPLPDCSELHKNKKRWTNPSELNGIEYDLQAMKETVLNFDIKFKTEYLSLPDYHDNKNRGYGPGYTPVDAYFLYCMIRELKPQRYIEVGSGLSTFYCSLAAAKNAEEKQPLEINCIEPYPYEALYKISNIQVHKKEVQDVDYSFFDKLNRGDVLFIDSSHVVKIDGDVPYLFLEILTRLKGGVYIHIHDIPFPYNVPYPPDFWILDKPNPRFWTEAMLIQAFLCYNRQFNILFSAPLLRHFEEPFLKEKLFCYKSKNEKHETFSSLWLEKTLTYL